MDPNGKLFYTKLEEINGGLGDKKTPKSKGWEGLQEMMRKVEAVF